jgi:hypothetical protein
MGQIGAEVGPDTLAPGAVAAGLGGQQLEPRPSVAGVVGRDPWAGICWWTSQQALHGLSTWSSPPTQDSSPVQLPPLGVEMAVLPAAAGRGGRPAGRGRRRGQLLPGGVLVQRLGSPPARPAGAAGHQLLQVLGEVPHRRLGARAVADDPEGAGGDWSSSPRVLGIGDLVTSGGLLTVGQQPAVAALGPVVGCSWPTSLVLLPWGLTAASR